MYISNYVLKKLCTHIAMYLRGHIPTLILPYIAISYKLDFESDKITYYVVTTFCVHFLFTMILSSMFTYEVPKWTKLYKNK